MCHHSGPLGVIPFIRKPALKASQVINMAMKRFSEFFELARRIRYARPSNHNNAIKLSQVLAN